MISRKNWKKKSTSKNLETAIHFMILIANFKILIIGEKRSKKSFMKGEMVKKKEFVFYCKHFTP